MNDSNGAVFVSGGTFLFAVGFNASLLGTALFRAARKFGGEA
ncbi:MAG TPA: hypothetical protein VGR73_15850 [Bryobacteraceae bacterium]|nr:hypothetical protein [Bryobacteraceae bacterium]